MIEKDESSMISLPSMEHTFHVSVMGNETKQLYKGDFTYRRPTLGDRAKSEVMRSRLNGDLATLNLDTQTFHGMIAILRYTLVKCPKWWSESDYGYELHDVNIVEEVYKAVLKFEKEWADQVYGKEETNKPS